MLYYLSLLTHMDQFAFFRLFGYLTFRAGGAVITALIFAFIVNGSLIQWLKIKQGKGQPIRTDGPQSHLVTKKGTPTMGGLMFLISAAITTLLWADLSNGFVWIVLLVTISYGLIGFGDDFLKLPQRNTKGLPGRVKLILQAAIGLVAAYCAMSLTPARFTRGPGDRW